MSIRRVAAFIGLTLFATTTIASLLNRGNALPLSGSPSYARAEFQSWPSMDNSPPTANPDHYTLHGNFETPIESPRTGVLKNDTDPDGNPLTCIFTSVTTTLGTATVFSTGKAAFSAAYGQTGSVTIPYTACDNHDACSSSTVTFDVTNQPPVTQPDDYTVHGSFETPVESPYTGVLKNDSDPEGDHLTCQLKRVDSAIGAAFVFTNGKAAFVPNNGQTGDVNVTYTVCDALGACSEALVTFHIVNQAPTAGSDVYTVRGSVFETPLETPNGVLKNDSDPDHDPVQTFFVRNDYPQGSAFVFANGKAAFVRNSAYPNYLAFSGAFSVSYALCDNLGACSQGIATFRLIGDGENNGVCSTCRRGGAIAVGTPVNVTNGNMYVQQQDYSLPSVGSGISVTRTFNSDSQGTGLFGRGWSSEYDESIAANDNYLARLSRPDGRAIYLARAVGSSVALLPLEGDFHGSLVQNGSDGFTLTMTDGSSHQFNSAGKLISLADRVGNQTTLAYDTGGKLTSVTDPFGRVLSLTTNTNGQVSSIADSLGTIATYTYGGGNQLLSVTYADNSAFQFSYDANYRLTSVTDALGNIVESHGYDSNGRAISSEQQGGVEHYGLNYVSDTETDVTDALGRVTKYTIDKSRGRNVVTRVEGLCNCGGGGSQVQTWTYDDQLNVTTKTDALNHVASYTYDANANRLTQTDASGTVVFTYNQIGEVLTRTDQLNNLTTNAYDAVGNPLSTTNALGKTTNFAYDTRGLLLAVTDARGKVTSFAYDSSGNLTSKTDPLSHATQFGYDARSRLTSVTNALGHVTAFAYDGVGKPTQITQADGTIISYQYDLAGRRTATIDAKGNRTTHAYDGASRLTSEIDALSQPTSYGYDPMSNLISQTDALGRVTEYEYDDFNRLKKVIYPPATTGTTRLFETLVYDAAGNVTQRTDTAGRVTSYAYDELNRVTSTTDPDNKITSFEYDALSRTTALVDALSQRYRFNYDAVGQLRHIRRGTAVMSFTYDAVGNRKRRTDYNGVLTTYNYDALNRLKTINYPDATTVNYIYDKLSRLQIASNENGAIDFDYNRMNRLTSVTDVFGQVIDYNYDANANRTKLTLNAGVVATYRYDAADRLTKIIDAAGVSTNYTYDVTNKLLSRRLPNGVLTNYQYDGLDRLTRLRDARGATTLADHQYQYNTANQITQIVEPTITRNYAYDPVDRLTSANYTNPIQPSENYAYDGVGNRTSSALSATYSYQPFNKLTSTGTASYSYDANGNLSSKTDAMGTWMYSWDFENRLTRVVRPDGLTVGYKYDALGRRIQRAPSAGVSTTFVYDGQDVVKDINSDGSTVDYLNGPGIDNKLRLTDSRLATTGPLYFLQDQLGSTTSLTNSNGGIVERVTYDAYGNSMGTSLTRYDYTGRERDPDTGLLYYRARWYDPQVGRFISEDPIGLGGGINQFAYVGNSPQNATDPSGLHEIDVHYYLTYFLAKQTGCFLDAEARLIADADQATDENSSTMPGPGATPRQRWQNATFHALHEGAQEGVGSPELWSKALNGGTNYVGLGRYLHYLQDTFSHSGYHSSTYGHGSGLHYPDKTRSNPQKSFRMAISTWFALLNYAREKKCKCLRDSADVPWNTVWRFILASGGPAYREINSHELEIKRRILDLPLR